MNSRAIGRSGGQLDHQQLATKNKFQKMQPTVNSESCFPSTSLQRRDADDALTTRTFARAHKSSTKLMVSAPGLADFRLMHDLQVGKRELRTDSKIQHRPVCLRSRLDGIGAESWLVSREARTCVPPRALLWQSRIRNKTRIPHVPDEPVQVIHRFS